MASLVVPLVGSAQDHVLPPADHGAVEIMAGPKAWDSINKPLTAAVTAKNPLEVDLPRASARQSLAVLGRPQAK